MNHEGTSHAFRERSRTTTVEAAPQTIGTEDEVRDLDQAAIITKFALRRAPRASANYRAMPVRTSIKNLSDHPQARRFLAMLPLPGCCFNSDNVSRFSHAKFSRNN